MTHLSTQLIYLPWNELDLLVLGIKRWFRQRMMSTPFLAVSMPTAFSLCGDGRRKKKQKKNSTIKGARSDNVCHWLCGCSLCFCSVSLSCGVQDVKGWPTPSSMCLGRVATARGIRAGVRGDRLSHPDAANLLAASHVNRYAIVWSAACSAWTEPPPRR